jgi:type I restriction enzyme M protein
MTTVPIDRRSPSSQNPQGETIQLSLFPLDRQETPSREAPTESTHAEKKTVPSSKAYAQPPGVPVEDDAVMLTWPFLFPPGSLALAIEQCVDRLCIGSRDDGFWQLVSLLCAKQEEERHPEWEKRFVTSKKEAKKEQGMQAIETRILALLEQVKTIYPTLFSTPHLSVRDLAPLVLKLGDHHLLTTELDPFGMLYQQWTGVRAREGRAQFFTPLGVAYFVVSLLQPQAHERVFDPTCGAGVFFRALHAYWQAVLTANVTLTEEKREQHLREYMQRSVYGADLDGRLIRLAGIQLALLQGDAAHTYHMDSLAFPENEDMNVQDAIPPGSFDLVVGNPPYSVPVSDAAILHKYELARVWKRQGERNFQKTERFQKKVSSEVLFLEQALNWLKPGGRLALVLPDNLLGNPATAYARYWLFKQAYVLASISLPSQTFQAQSQTGMKTSVLVLRKMTETERKAEEKAPQNYSVYMAQVDEVGYDSRGKTVYARMPDGELIQREGTSQVNNELPAVLAHYWQFQMSCEVKPPPATAFITS